MANWPEQETAAVPFPLEEVRNEDGPGDRVYAKRNTPPTRTESGGPDSGTAFHKFTNVAGPVCTGLWKRFTGISRRRKMFAAAANLGITSLILLVAVVAYHAIGLPRPSLAELRRETNSVRILDANGRLLARRGEHHIFLKTEQIPRHLISAVLATEDRRFIDHIGIDVIGLMRATYRNILAGRYVEGGSTITQQLAKNAFLKPRRTLSRKIQELILAFWLEVRLSKKQILELYLNRVYFGAGAYGIEAAANRYFGKPAQRLTLGESAVLAGVLKAPSRYSPQRDPVRTLKRARVVLQNMIDAGAITREQAVAVLEKPLHFVKSRPRKRMRYANYAIDWIYEALPGKIGHPAGDIIVHTTIDRDLQVYAQRLVARRIDADAMARNARNAATVLLDHNGGIKTLVGGQSYTASQFNRATRARRQPGSAFKPFVYVAAIESGFTADSVAFDEPITVRNWTPRNYGNKYVGQVTLRKALALSINSVAVQLFMEVGRDSVVRVANRLGIKSRLHNLPSLALGTAEVTPLELATAYVPFSNGGYGVAPHIITKVTTRDGAVLYEYAAPAEQRVLQPHVVSEMNDMMASTLSWGTGRRAAIPPHPAAGKTGTTQGFRDAWFAGYTAHYTAVVWVGNDKAERMDHITGGSLPASIWRELMARAHEDLDPVPLPGSHADQVRGNGPLLIDVPAPEPARVGRPGLLSSLLGVDTPGPLTRPQVKARVQRSMASRFNPQSKAWSSVFSRN